MLSYSGPSPLCPPAVVRRAQPMTQPRQAARFCTWSRLSISPEIWPATLELALAVVARGEGPGLVEHVDQHRRAELGQRLRGDRVGLEELLGLVHDELEALGIGDRGAMGAVAGDDDGLEPLGAHHGAQTAAADGPPAVVDDARRRARRARRPGR